MMLPKRLWIIEDMEDLQPIYLSIFNETQFKISFFKSFDEFSHKYQQAKDLPDLIIADIMLEDGHFFKLLNEADIALNVPFMVVSASDEYETISNAFEAGAIDYVLKPLKYNEVRAKVERHLLKIEEKYLESSKSLEALQIDLSNFTNKEYAAVIYAVAHDDIKSISSEVFGDAVIIDIKGAADKYTWRL